MTTFNASGEQALIIHNVSDGNNVAGDACAGTGKTTTAVQAISQLPGPVHALAFNRDIALELGERLPNATCKTSHAFGFAALRGAVRASWKKPDKRKTWKILRDLPIPSISWRDATSAIGLAKSAGLVPEGCSLTPAWTGMPDTEEAWADLFRRNDVSLPTLGDEDGPEVPLADTIEICRAVINKSITLTFQGHIDFDDMLHIPTCFGHPYTRTPFLFADEAQDLSPIQHQQIERMLEPGSGQLLIMGDPHQAIYAFRGADAESWQNLITHFNLEEFPLHHSFRCPQAVVREAQRYVPHFASVPSAPEGVVRDAGDGWGEQVTEGDAILCRNNKPLVSAFYRLVVRGVPCRIRGRDIGENLIKVAKKVIKMGGATPATFAPNLELWTKGERARLEAAKAGAKQIENLLDKAECLAIICDRVRHREGPGADAKWIIQDLEDMFTDQRNVPVILSTIHKAKGLEWPRVWFLDSDLIPSRFATQEWQLQQERNLAYVAITRAQQELVYASSETA